MFNNITLARSRSGSNINIEIKMDGLASRPAGEIGALLNRNIPAAINDVIRASYADIRRGIPKRVSQLERIHGPREHLRDSVKLEPARSGTEFARVYSDDPRMVFIEKNTKAHVILPKKGKALKFQVGGKTVFARRVQHPGTTGKHVWQRADAQVRMRLLPAIDRAITASFQGASYVRKYWRAGS